MPNKTKALRTWKNFVLKFRKEFDAEFRSSPEVSNSNFERTNKSGGTPDENTSLSLLLYAAAASLSIQIPPGPASLNSHREQNPKYRVPTIDLKTASNYSQQLCSDLKHVMPQPMPFLLPDYSQNYLGQFSKVLKAIESSEITSEPFVLGYTYQFWRDCDRKNAQSEIQSADKHIDRDRLVAFTQIYTPEWIVEFIIANSILPQVRNSLASQSKLYRWLIPTSQ